MMIKDLIRKAFIEIFKAASVIMDSPSISYECIYSDRYISTGRSVFLPVHPGETDKEMTFPMDETECVFFSDCIPEGF